MKFRRRRGATLGLVVVALLIIIIIGVGAFFLMKIMGGGREVANASDAGVLNVAKNVLVKIGVQAPAEFSACAEPVGGVITLATYNRCVAQTLLVALNAEKEDTDAGRTNAKAVIAKLKTLGQDLRNYIEQQNNIKRYFEDLTAANGNRMNGNTSIDLDGYRTAFMKPGLASNVYVNSDSLPISALPVGWLSKGQVTGPNGEKYLAGYIGMPIGNEQIYGVPVFPQTKCHLVSSKEFDSSKSPSADVPPNAFRTESKSLNSQSGTFGGAVACAIVGSIDKQFAAAIPGGYIEIANAPGLTVPADWRESVLAADSIFNDQLYYGLDVSPLANGSFSFSRHPGEQQAWVNYNNSTGSDPNGHNPALLPTLPSNDFPLHYTLRAGCTQGQWAEMSDALQIKTTHPCNDFSFGANPDPICLAAYNCMRKVYNGLGTSAIQQTPDSFCAVEYMKANVCNALQGAVEDPGQGCFNIQPPAQSGLKAFDHNKHYPAPPEQVAFAQEGNILQLIQQATSGPCTTNVYNEIAQRCREIVPGSTDAEIRAILSTTIPMGKNQKPEVLYISRGANGALAISSTKPPSYTEMTPDGPDPNSIQCETVDYVASDYQVNTKSNPPETSVGDTGVWDAPFLRSPQVKGHDSARWRPSSGAGNLLGRLEFSQVLTGGGDYCVPN